MEMINSMSKYLQLVFLLGQLCAQNVNIDGFAFLDDSEVHDSIKINFDMEVPASYHDSTFTNIDGHYEISIPQGIYSITYSYPDMISTTYSGIVLYNDSTLADYNFPYSLDTLYVPIEFQTIQAAVDQESMGLLLF